MRLKSFQQSITVAWAAIALATFLGSADAVNVWKIGVNLPYTYPALGTAVSGVVNMMTMLAPSLNTLDPTGQNQFQLVPMAPDFTALTAAETVLSLAIDQNVVGLVGDFASSHTGPAALAGSRFRLWQCSGSSSAVTLSGKENYPYFFRTMADDPQQGAILANFVKFMGWTSASVLATSDAYGQSVASAFLATAPAAGIQILANQVIQSGQIDVTSALQNILAGGSQIIIISMMPQDGLFVLREAKRQGMIGPNWVWLGPEGWGIFPTIELNAGDMELANGLMYVMPLEASYNAGYNATVTQWASTYGANTPVPQYGFLFSDCMTAVARGILSLVNQYGAANVASRNYPADLTRFLTPFTGLTGSVRFNQATGDRYSYFSVFNFWNGVATAAYQVNPDLSVVASIPPKFYGGGSTVPRDRPMQASLVPDWSTSSGAALAAVNALLVLVIFAAAADIAVHREHETIKSLGFPFLLLISLGLMMILGSNILSLGVPSGATCSASLWVFVYGIELVMASCTVKAYRLWSIFENKALMQSSQMSSMSLVSAVGAIILVQTVILGVWSGIGPQVATLVSNRTYFYYTCQSSNAAIQSGLSGATLGYNILLLLALTVLAYKTRSVTSANHESIWLFYTSNNTLMAGVVVFMFSVFQFGDSMLAAFVVRQVMIIYATLFAFGALIVRVLASVHGNSRGAADAGSHHQETGSAKPFGNSTMIKSSGGGGSSTGARAAKSMKMEVTDASGAVTLARGLFAVKQLGGLMHTWHMHNVNLSVHDGTLQLIPINSDPEVGTAIRLQYAVFDKAPANKANCVDLKVGEKGWSIQFESAEEREKWLSVLSLVHGVGTKTVSHVPSKSYGASMASNLALRKS
ncbi:periplasmic binding protein-like I [Blastocladiella britannica]|nr:periplasmic binding protein-like I [Blastocladiella britannica]